MAMAAFSGSSPLRLAYLMIKPSLAESPPSRLLREPSNAQGERREEPLEVETELIGLRKKVRIRKNTGKSKSGKGRAISLSRTACFQRRHRSHRVRSLGIFTGGS